MVRLLTILFAVQPAPQSCVPGRQYMRSGCTYDVVVECQVGTACQTMLVCWALKQNLGRRACPEWKQTIPPDLRVLTAAMLFEEIREAVAHAIAESSAAEGGR